MINTLITTVIAFVVLCLFFRLLELTRPRNLRLPLLRAGFRTDLAYWIFTPFVTR